MKIFKKLIFTIIISTLNYYNSIYPQNLEPQKIQNKNGQEFVLEYNNISLLPKLKDLYVQYYQDLYKESNLQEATYSWNDTLKEILSLYKKFPDIFILQTISFNDNVLGFAIYYKTDKPEELYLFLTILDKSVQNSGLFKTILQNILEKLPDTKKITINVPNENTTIQNILKHLNFKLYYITDTCFTYQYNIKNSKIKKNYLEVSPISKTSYWTKDNKKINLEWATETNTIREAKKVYSKSFWPISKNGSFKDYENYWEHKTIGIETLIKSEIYNTFFYTARYNKKIVGFSLFFISNNQEEAYLDYLAVDPDFRGSGLSKELIFGIFKKLPKLKTLTLYTKKNFKTAIGVYQHLGFKINHLAPFEIGFEFRQEQSA